MAIEFAVSAAIAPVVASPRGASALSGSGGAVETGPGASSPVGGEYGIAVAADAVPAGADAEKPRTAQQEGGKRKGQNELTDKEKEVVRELQRGDAEVRRHERAHSDRKSVV